MSANSPTREVAKRVFASEFNDASFTFKESDDERAPVYLLLPTGTRANRVFITGTLTEKEDVGEDDEYWRARVNDGTGTFYIYAGQYQPEAANKIREVEAPTRVAVVGKPRTYEQDDGTVNVSIRPERITEVDKETRETWTITTAERTGERLSAFKEWQKAAADAPDGEASAINEYASMASEQYDPSLRSYQYLCLEALEQLELVDEIGELTGLDEADSEESSEEDGAADEGDAGQEAADDPTGEDSDETTDTTNPDEDATADANTAEQ